MGGPLARMEENLRK